MPYFSRLFFGVLVLLLVPRAAQSQETDAPAAVERPAAPIRIPAESLLTVVDRTAGIVDDDRPAIAAGFQTLQQFTAAELQSAAALKLANVMRRDPAGYAASASAAVVAELLRDPESQRGLPFQLSGYVQGIREQPALPNNAGLKTLYEVRLFTPASQRTPVIVLAAQLPENLPGRNQAIDDVSVTGFFVKLIQLVDVESETGDPPVAPVIVAAGITWEPLLQDNATKIPLEILRDVRDKTGGIRAAEADAYYRILDHAARGNVRLQLMAARTNRKQRIARYENEAKEKYQSLAASIAQKKAQAPDQAEKLDAALAQEHRNLERRLQDHRKFDADPEVFPTFIDLFQDAEPYRGELVTLSGHIRKLIEYPAGENRYGLKKLYEAWLYTADSQLHPCVIVFTELPQPLLNRAGQLQSIPQGEDLLEEVSFSGYFFKLYGYDAQDATRFAPLFLARTLQWSPRDNEFAGAPPLGIYLFALAALVCVVWGLRRVALRDRAIRDQRLQQELEAAKKPDFEQILLTTGPVQPDFSKIEATNEGPDFRELQGRTGDELEDENSAV